jgi:hypothetical protein
VYRKIALKLLASYTLAGQTTQKRTWAKDRLYFNNDLLEV